jgi:hypothetical protein
MQLSLLTDFNAVNYSKAVVGYDEQSAYCFGILLFCEC